MSVLIKGIDVPPNCWWCPVKFWNDTEYICPFSHKHINSGDSERHDDCLLIPAERSEEYEIWYTEEDENWYTELDDPKFDERSEDAD